MDIKEIINLREEYINGFKDLSVYNETVLADNPFIRLEVLSGQKDRKEGKRSVYLDYFEGAVPLSLIYRYIISNKPLIVYTAIEKFSTHLGGNVQVSPIICATETEVFEFLQNLTEYGLLLTANSLECPLFAKEQLTLSVKSNDYNSFHAICESNHINLSVLAICVGYFNIGNSIKDLDDDDDDDDEKTKEDVFDEIMAAMGVPFASYSSELSRETVMCAQELGCEDEDDKMFVSLFVLLVIYIYAYLLWGNPDVEEISIINQYLDLPNSEPYVRFVQKFFLEQFSTIPECVNLKPCTSNNASLTQVAETPSEESLFALPKNFFNLVKDNSSCEEHFEINYSVEKGGPKLFLELINYIASQGFIETDYRTKRLFAYVLTGRWKPEDYQAGETITWSDNDHEGKELCYLIKTLIVSDQGKKATKYKKMHRLFIGPCWSKTVPDKDQGNNASKNFKKALHDRYPTICKL